MTGMMKWLRRGMLVAVVPIIAVGCHGRHHRAGMSEAELREHAQDGAEFVLDHVDASEDQEGRVSQILDQLVPDLVALRPEKEALATELSQVLGADQVDPARVEEIRKKAIALADRASARMAKSLVETAQVLDKEQRAKLIRHWQRRRGA
jgi:Spy/CpxP family protein refolding chaperone